MRATSKANVQAMVEERAPKAVRSEGTTMLDGKDLAPQMFVSQGCIAACTILQDGRDGCALERFNRRL